MIISIVKERSIKMSEKIVLIDGHSILNRAFYGLPDLTNSEGMHTNAVYGFLNIMLKILEEEKPDYLTVAFDVKQPTFRHKMFAEYKGTRKGMPEELREQVPLIQDVLEAMGVTIVMKGGYEADDVLGTIAKMAESKGLEVSLVSGDRDLLQLASDKILIRIPKTKRGGTEIENYHTQEVIDKYGLTPAQIIDLKGLMGDSADNIPGVAGVGEKTAVKILTAFPTIEEAYEHLEEVEPKRARELLRAGEDAARMSKTLATIKTDCDLEYDLETAKMGELFTKEAFEWVKRLELKSLLKRFDPNMALEAAPEFDWFERLSSEKDFNDFLSRGKKEMGHILGIAYLGDEWTGQGAKRKKKSKKAGGQLSLVFEEGMDLAIAEEDGVKEYHFLGVSISYITEKVKRTGVALVSDELSGEVLLEGVKALMAKAKKVAIMDLKNEMHLSTEVEHRKKGIIPKEQQGFEEKWVFGKLKDIKIAAYLLNPMKDTYMVDDVARDYLGITLPSYQELFGKETLAEVLEKQDTTSVEKLVEYFGYQSCIPAMSYEKIEDELESQGMLALFENIEIPTSYYLYEMERLGVQANREVLNEMSKTLGMKVAELETDIYDLAGEEFNINSPKQLGVILFEKMKLPFAKKTKTGYSTSADILEKLRSEDPIVDKILEYRQVSKLKSTYADGLPVYIEEDDRIHGKFNQTITATGRISSTDPNLQNIPIRMELGRKLRQVFEAKEGCIFLDADYSQIELRVLAHMSGDQELIEAYRQGRDIHKTTASKVFNVPFDEVTSLQRRNAKAVNFGIVYGISAFGLSQDLGISKKEADEVIKQYFATYPAIKEFLDGLVDSAKETGVADTIFGRKRPVPELKSSNFMQRSFGERVAMNSPIQGTAADIIKIAMIRVAKRLKEEGLSSRVVLQIHDELLVETKLEEKEQVKKILQEEMPAAAELDVPLEIDVQEGATWYEAH